MDGSYASPKTESSISSRVEARPAPVRHAGRHACAGGTPWVSDYERIAMSSATTEMMADATAVQNATAERTISGRSASPNPARVEPNVAMRCSCCYPLLEAGDLRLNGIVGTDLGWWQGFGHSRGDDGGELFNGLLGHSAGNDRRAELEKNGHDRHLRRPRRARHRQ